MIYSVYIIHSHPLDRYYVGQTNNIIKRLERHNLGYVKSTKSYIPWTLVYSEHYNSRSQAMKRESVIKAWKSKNKIRELVDASR